MTDAVSTVGRALRRIDGTVREFWSHRGELRSQAVLSLAHIIALVGALHLAYPQLPAWLSGALAVVTRVATGAIIWLGSAAVRR